jgi:hypothetical protein
VNAPATKVFVVPIERLDFRTLEGLIVRQDLNALQPRMPLCYSCESYGPLAPHRGRLLCSPCGAIARFRGQ